MKQGSIQSDMFRLPGAAAYLGVSPGLVRKWLRLGTAPRHARLGKLILLRRADLDAFFDQKVAA